MLENIKAGYYTFQQNMIRDSKKLPTSLEPDLDFYGNALSQHLGVAKQSVRQNVPILVTCAPKVILKEVV